MTTNLVLKPRISEKAYGVSQATRTFVFDVPTDANKQLIATAVAEQYDVTVTGIKTITLKGKNKRTFLSRRGKFVRGTRSDVKKAYVTLKEGDNIPIFAAEEEAEAKAEKEAAKAAKKAKKESK